MSRDELKEIIRRVIVQMQDDDGPRAACMFGDNTTPCDATTKYNVGEES